MRIGFDIDGVLADFNTSYIALVKTLTERNLFPDGYFPTTWNYPESLGYTNGEVAGTWDYIKKDPEFWYSLQPLPGALVLCENWRRILDAGHDVVFATARPGLTSLEQSVAWLRNIGCTYTDVTITSAKGQFCLDRFVDCYIDDRKENVIDVCKTSPTTRTYLLDAPYNTGSEGGAECAPYTRVPSVEAFFVAEGLL